VRARRGRAAAPQLAWLWWLVVVGCALGFVALAVIVNGQGGLAFDAPVTALVMGLPVPVDAWMLATHAGDIAIVPVAAVLVLWLLRSRQHRMAVVVVVVLVATALFTDHVKDLIQRPRPPGDPLVSAPGYSFPSGHSMMSAVTYGLVVLVAWRSHLSLRSRQFTMVLLVVLIAAVGLSRIALGVHYPSDVLASWLAATATVLGVALATRSEPSRGRTDPA
jgi:membrane-associated phospholipid phosphatase